MGSSACRWRATGTWRRTEQTPKGRGLGLCAIYEAASLSASQLARLREAEARWPHVLFVAYATPDLGS
jgi:hypothetical protein